jgi:hypothetical protein
MIGSRLLKELVSRGHTVVAVARDPARIPAAPSVTASNCDILDARKVAETVRDTDAVISAYSPGIESPGKQLSLATESLIDGLTAAGVKRLIAVGGAASLEVAPGVRLIDAPNFPVEWKAIGQAHIDALEILKSSGLDWTSASPSALIEPGERTGKFRTGNDQLLTDAQGNSRISAEDFAIAVVDELEQGKHIKARFTAGY